MIYKRETMQNTKPCNRCIAQTRTITTDATIAKTRNQAKHETMLSMPFVMLLFAIAQTRNYATDALLKHEPSEPTQPLLKHETMQPMHC